MTTPEIQPLLYTVVEAAQALRISRARLYELMGEGRLKSLKLGQRRLISRKALHEFVAELEKESDPDDTTAKAKETEQLRKR